MCIVCLLFVAIVSCCLLPVEERLRHSYFALRDSQAWKWTAGVIAPLAVVGLFLGVALAALVRTPATDAYAERHAREVFAKADKNGDNVRQSCRAGFGFTAFCQT